MQLVTQHCMGFEIQQKRVRDEMEIEDEIRRESKRGVEGEGW